MAIALDEFQAVEAFDSGNVEHALRAAVQDQRAVGYVFAGSEPSLMEKHGEPQAALLQGRPGGTAAEDRPGAIRRLARAALQGERHPARAGLGAAIVDLAGNVPYDVQRLAHETWDDVHQGARRARASTTCT